MSPMPAYGGGPGSGYNASLDKGTNTLITIWIVTSVAMLFTTGRLYVRGYMQRRLRSDDYLTVFSVVGYLFSLGAGKVSQ